MVSVVLARPEKKNGVGFYGGRVALLRCTKDKVAKNNSKYHKRGSIYKRDCSVDSVMYKNQMTKKNFPAIKRNQSILDKTQRFCRQLKSKDPDFKLSNGCKWADIVLQLDNAPPHCKGSKRLFPMMKKGASRNVVDGVHYGPKVRLLFQPPNSPDLNVLYLGFFSMFCTKIHNI